MKTYVFLDVSKKQEFIFKNNKLKDIQYNSFVLKALSEIFSEDELENRENLRTFLEEMPISLTNFVKSKGFDNKDWMSGGGSTYLCFKIESEAKKFIESYSIEVLEHYPEIELYMTYVTISDDVCFSDILSDLRAKSDELKDLRKSRFRRISYGVEELDDRGFPIEFLQEVDENEPIQNGKNNYRKAFTQTFVNKLAKSIDQNLFEVEYEQDNFKLKNGDKNLRYKNYIGVISIDGNRMGELVSRVKTFEEYKSLSQEIDEYYAYVVAKSVEKISRSDQKPLKIAPIILAGDDICLVVHARKSIPFAKLILEEIRNEENLVSFITLSSLLKNAKMTNMSACAGISIVKIGYPFFEAVEEAEAMCKSSKLASHSSASYDSFLDWTINKGGKREIQDHAQFLQDANNKYEFTAKPYPVDSCAERQNQQAFNGTIKEILTLNNLLSRAGELNRVNQNGGEPFSTQLNRLQEAVYYGKDIFNMHLQRSTIKTEFSKWLFFDDGNTTTYMLKDLLDAMDLFDEVSNVKI